MLGRGGRPGAGQETGEDGGRLRGAEAQGTQGELSARPVRTTSERGQGSREAVPGGCGYFLKPSAVHFYQPTATVSDLDSWAPSRPPDSPPIHPPAPPSE